jgi:type I restriction-modification system DNA methylase subunit
MAILTNNLLFNHTYLKDLTADTSIDPDIPFAPRDLGDWYNARNTSSTQTLVASWVQPMLSLLELEIHAIDSGDENTFELTTAYDHDTAIGICYMTPPGADLDTTPKGQFWMAQAVLATRRHEPALRWVILTNGDLWRLLDAQALRRYEAFVQIDVGQLARGASDPSALRVLFRCFYRTAFEQDVDGKTGIEKLLDASDHATEKAEKHLKERVSGTDGIMAQLCLGLVRSTGKSSLNEEERDAIYRDATTLLYRMLFLLYAESRSLLPVENPSYRAVSMLHLVEAAKDGQQRGLDQPQATRLWSSLKRLSNAIYESDTNLDIPSYNGGLFDDDDHPYLRDGFIADQFLSRALFDLAFLQNGNDIRSLDFRDLSVRHLGSLYEGMIEYKLFIAEEPMLARRDKSGVIHFTTQEQGGGLRRNDQEIKAGEVYFAQSSGERRATGTYYTPEHIVDYIVHNTVVRGLEERRTSLEEKLNAWSVEIMTADPSERIGLQSTVDEELLKFVEEQVLTFTVCDPAMGSGHFLVNAAHNIADFIVETLNLTTWENQRLDTAPGYWRRRAAERCLYGVDISDMAVELAKLSLWIAIMAVDKPLSFLDHHLRQGNSLIGTHFEELAKKIEDSLPSHYSKKERVLIDRGQLSMLEDPTFSRHFNIAMNLLDSVSERIAINVEDIKRQERDFEKARAELASYRDLADMTVAREFGVFPSNLSFIRLTTYLLSGNGNLTDEDKLVMREVRELAKKWSFFHWGLEFPELFVNFHSEVQKHETGFDAVVGNPPYDELSEETRGEPIYELLYLQSTPRMAPAMGHRINLYRLFIAQAISILKNNGRHSFIVPMSLLADRFTLNIRRHLLENVQFIVIEQFPQKDDPNNRVFQEAKLSTCIYVIRKNKSDKEQIFLRIHPGRTIEEKSPQYVANQSDFFVFDDDNLSIPGLGQEAWNLVMKLSTSERLIKLGEYASALPGELMINHQFDAYLTDSSKGEEIIRGSHISRYQIVEPKQGEPLFLNRQKYLSDFKRSTKAFHHKDRRIVYQRYAAIDNYRRLIASILPSGYFCSHTVGYLSGLREEASCGFLTALLNTRLLDWRFDLTSTNNNINGYEVEALPIPKIGFSTPLENRKYLSDQAMTVYETYLLGKTNLLEILDQVCSYHIDVIHNLMASLAEQMIILHQNRQVEMKSFLEWLESQSGTNLEDLTGKTYLLNFLGDYQKAEPHLALNDLAGILVKNKRKLAIDPNERGFQRSLEKRYQESLVVLLPIKKRLAMTDQLIDQIVYRLYGLSEEEIRIVEGK